MSPRHAAPALALLLAACAGAPVPATRAPAPVPPNRVFALPPAPVLPGEAARITVRRDEDYLGSGQSLLLSVDGQRVAEFRSGEVLTLDLRPGEHRLAVRAFQDTAETRERSVMLAPGDHLRFRLRMHAAGAMLDPEAPAAP